VCVVYIVGIEGYEILYVYTLYIIIVDRRARGIFCDKTIRKREREREKHYGIESHVVSHRGTRSTLAIARIRMHTHTH